ncbi:MAG: hypothetical protein K2G03_01710, partial [Bacilli bacterium]|nr:hypothetical protein [Bacilli bacterium]
MKFNDAFKYAFIKSIRNKKNVYFIIIMTFCVFALIASISFRIAYFDISNKKFENDYDARRIDVEDIEGKSDRFEQILKIDHVVEMYEYNYQIDDSIEFSIDGTYQQGEMTLKYGSEVTQPKNINGERIKNDDTGVAVCAKRFTTRGSSSPWTRSNVYIRNMDNSIGSLISIEKDIFEVVDGKELITGTY